MDYRLVPAAAALHIIDEYIYPGGFLDAMRETSPRYGGQATPLFAVVINGLFVFLCVLGALFGRRNKVFGLSVLGLLLLNSFAHIAGTIIRRRYNPGTATAVLLSVLMASSVAVCMAPPFTTHYFPCSPWWFWGSFPNRL